SDDCRPRAVCVHRARARGRVVARTASERAVVAREGRGAAALRRHAAQPVAGGGMKNDAPWHAGEIALQRRAGVHERLAEIDERGFVVEVEQSFGNCPQYIQARTPSWTADAAAFTHVRTVEHGGAHLNAAARALLRAADTFFIATAAPESAAPKPARNAGV